MKNITQHKSIMMSKFLKLTVLLITISFTMWGCAEENFDMPPVEKPTYKGKQSISIKDFKEKYNQDLFQITDNDTISGIIIANDISGNLYKQIFIEDETGGLLVAIDRTSLHNNMRIGQTVFIETKNLYIGKYGGMHQLGGIFLRTDGTTSIGQMSWETAKESIFLHDYPNKELVTPITIDQNNLKEEFYGRLVTLEGVYFEDGGESFSRPTEAGGVQTLNRVIKFVNSESGTVTARMSSAANFASSTIPRGIGNITGVLTVFNTTTQILVRELSDINFEENLSGWGIENDPWNVSYAIANQDNNKSGWIKGYIIGTLKGNVNMTENPFDSNDDVDFTPPFDIDHLILIAETPTETDWSKMAVVNLPESSPLFNAVNLGTNHDVIGSMINVKGNLSKILGGAGINVVTGGESEFKLFGSGEVIFSAPFSSTLLPFEKHSVNGTQEWSIRTFGNDTYAYMSGFDSGAKENEDWLISPSINLTDYEAAHILFNHAINYSTVMTDFTMYITTNYTGSNPKDATWKQIAIINYPAGNNFTFVNSDKINIPQEFMGQANVRFAFKYTSSATRAGAWQIKDLFVYSGEGKTGTITDPVNPIDPNDPVDPNAKTIFTETFGNGEHLSGNRPKIAAFTSFDNTNVTFTDSHNEADIRSTATINPHVWFPANKNSELVIEGIDISAYNNVKLQYDIASNGAATADKLQVKINGQLQTIPATPINDYATISVTQTITSSANLKIEFISNSADNSVGFRLDNIKLVGVAN